MARAERKEIGIFPAEAAEERVVDFGVTVHSAVTDGGSFVALVFVSGAARGRRGGLLILEFRGEKPSEIPIF